MEKKHTRGSFTGSIGFVLAPQEARLDWEISGVSLILPQKTEAEPLF